MKGVRPAGRQAAEPPKPSQRPRSSFLRENEARGGHVLDKHVGKTDEELLARLKSEPHLREVSTFTDEATAERVIKAAIAENQDEIGKWLKNNQDTKLALAYKSPVSVGRMLIRGGTTGIEKNEVTLVLRKLKDEFYVLTAYVK